MVVNNWKKIALLLLVLFIIVAGISACNGTQVTADSVKLIKINLCKSPTHQYADYVAEDDEVFCIENHEKFVVELLLDNPSSFPIYSVQIDDTFVTSVDFLPDTTAKKVRFLYTLPELDSPEEQRSITIKRFVFTYIGNPVTHNLTTPATASLLEAPRFVATLSIDDRVETVSVRYMQSMEDLVSEKLQLFTEHFSGVYTREFGEGDKVDYYYFFRDEHLYVLTTNSFTFALNEGETEYTVTGLTAAGAGILNRILNVPSTYEDKPVTAIGEGAFEGRFFSLMQLPNTIKKIEKDAFKNCKSLSSLTFETNSALLEIGNSAFEGTVKLSTFAFSNSITKIGEKAFRDSGFKQTQTSPANTVIIPASVQNIGNEAFRKTNAKIVRFAEDATLIYMGDLAFAQMEELLTVDTKFGDNPDVGGIKTIGKDAFYGCVKLSTVSIKKGLEKIGDKAFRDCTALKTIVLNKDVKYIGNQAFLQCNLTTFSVAENSKLETISNKAFEGNKNLEKLDLTNSVSLKEIGHNPFYRCEKLRQVRIGASTPPEIKDFSDPHNAEKRLIDLSYEYLKFYVFENCIDSYEQEWGSINVPTGRMILIAAIDTISDDNWAAKILPGGKVLLFDVFSVNENITPPTTLFGYPIAEIGPYAFHPDIKSVTLPTTVTTIHDRAFYKCSKLETVNFSALTQLKTIGKEAFYETKIKSFVANSTFELIGKDAFYNTQELIDADFRNALSLTIATDAFRSSKVKELYFGSGTLVVQSGAFNSCNNFEFIWFAREDTTGIDILAFTGYNTGITISVPNEESIAKYQLIITSSNYVSREG